jgi:hypothetical protein
MNQNQTKSNPSDAEQDSGKGLDETPCSTFADHKEQTAKDLEYLIEMLTELAAEVREGNMKKWEEFWWAGGTEEGDAKIHHLREMLLLRYAHREESIESNIKMTERGGQ